MKKLLFVTPKFSSGGAEKSLLMLLYMLSERDDLQLDLLLFKKEGIFIEQLPSNVNIIDGNSSLHCAFSKFSNENIKSVNDFLMSIVRPIATVLCSILKRNLNQRNQIRWKYFYKHFIKTLNKTYDYAFGYLDGEAIYYVVDKVKATKKYGWNQNDYDGTGLIANFDKYYYRQLDKIITLSDQCESILVKDFPEFVSKIVQIPPLVSSAYIRCCAQKFEPKVYNNCSKKIISVGRLVEQKGFDIAISAASIMKQKGFNFNWYIIGNGELYDKLKTQIYNLGLDKNVFLLGEKSNPYPYIKKADVFVQPSRFEGKSVILNEAKMLSIPILTTNYPTVRDQIVDHYDGIIVRMDAENIAEGIITLLTDKVLASQLIQNLSNTDFENDKVARDYLELIEEE